MAFSVIKQNGHISYGVKEFVCDTVEDVATLSLDCAPGSTAFIIATSQTYMLNNVHEWTEINKK